MYEALSLQNIRGSMFDSSVFNVTQHSVPTFIASLNWRSESRSHLSCDKGMIKSTMSCKSYSDVVHAGLTPMASNRISHPKLGGMLRLPHFAQYLRVSPYGFIFFNR